MRRASSSSARSARVTRAASLDGRAVVGEAGIVAFAVLATPEALVAAPGLEVPRERFVQLVGVRFADVDDLAALTDDVDAGLAAQRADPRGIGIAARSERAVGERGVARDQRRRRRCRARIVDVVPAAHELGRVGGIARAVAPELEVQMLEPGRVLRIGADDADRLAGAHALARLRALRRRQPRQRQVRVVGRDRRGRRVVDHDRPAARRPRARPHDAIARGEREAIVRHDEAGGAVRRTRARGVIGPTREHQIDAEVSGRAELVRDDRPPTAPDGDRPDPAAGQRTAPRWGGDGCR